MEIPDIDTCDFEDSVVRCHADQISVHLPTCAFTDGELDLGEIHLAGVESVAEAPDTILPACMGHYDANQTKVVTFAIAGISNIP